MILETTFLIDLLRNETSAMEKFDNLENSGEQLYTTSITVFELWQGVVDMKNEAKKAEILNMLNSLVILSLDLESAKRAGEIYRELRNKGALINSEDAMIAGIAKTHNEILLTRDLSHFQRIPELRIEGY